MTDEPATEQRLSVAGEVLDVDYDRDVISVRFEDGSEHEFAFELFDQGDVYQPGQHFAGKLDAAGLPVEIAAAEAKPRGIELSGYVESVDPEDHLVWVYIRSEEGWLRKVMPLHLFEENGLARPGHHFILEVDEEGTPLALRDDEQELEMQPLATEETKPRWTNRPAAEAEPES